MSSYDWALALYDCGYQPVPVPLKGKRPVIPWKRWQTERVPREQVEAWFLVGQQNIALISGTVSNTVVVDGDSQEACAWIEAYCTRTWKVMTSKGAHYYYRHPGGRVPNAVRVLDDPPVDLRGDGGLTIAPGSLHHTGVYYRVAGDEDPWSVDDLPVFQRDWFGSLEPPRPQTFDRPTLCFPALASHEAYRLAERYLSAVPGAIQTQGGDAHTFVVACKLVRGFDLTDQEALQLLLGWNQRCQPPWSEKDLADKIRHARAYGSGEFGALLPRCRRAPGVLCFGVLE